jgi:hypothetical protein
MVAVPSEAHTLLDCGMYILGTDGEPIHTTDTLAWGRWMETADRHVAKTKLGIYWISTVFMGLDHSFGSGGPPVLWETMVFGEMVYSEFSGREIRDTVDRDGYFARYSSKEAALLGHEMIVARVREELPLQLAN